MTPHHRPLYNFRANHRPSTNGAAANGSWDNSSADGAFAYQDSDNGTADNRWHILRN
jgi:hypothetical protein